MDDGDIYVFDLTVMNFSKFKIDYKLLFPGKPSTIIVDIKCHPTKMHRLLIAYKQIAVGVFSINKNKFIQTIMFDTDLDAKTANLTATFRGDVLAVEWIQL